MLAKPFVKLFTSSGPSLQTRKPVLNNQLEHDSLPLLCHGTISFFAHIAS